jgi:hypothetical protein
MKGSMLLQTFVMSHVPVLIFAGDGMLQCLRAKLLVKNTVL